MNKGQKFLRLRNIVCGPALIALTGIPQLTWAPALQAAPSTFDDVHLIQSFFADAPIARKPYAEGLASFADFDGGSVFDVGVQGGFSVIPKLEIGSAVAFRNVEPEGNGDGESGVTDIPVYGRYQFFDNLRTKIAAGTYVTLPVGSEDIGQSNTNFGGFAALRHAVASHTVLTGTIGLDLLEQEDDDRETSVNLGGGVIHSLGGGLNILGELKIQTETDFFAIGGGADYVLGGGRIRGGISLGLDDGAPDFALSVGYLLSF